MGEKIVEFLLVLVMSFFLCEAKPDLNTSGNVDFYREGQNITAKWKTLYKDYLKIQVKYCDVTNNSPCLIHDVRDAKATEVTFRALQFSKYECSLLVHDVGPLVYTSPRMPAAFRPDFSNITFIQKDEFITGTWQPFGSSYTTLKIRWCEAKSDAQDSSCDLYTVGNVSATTATVKVNKDKKYVCSVVVIDVTGESHSSEPILAEVKDTRNTNIIIIIVVVVIVIALIVVAVVLYLVLKRYCQAKDAYVVMPETEREAKKSMKRIRKQSVEHVISGDEEIAAKYQAKDAHGEDNHAFIDNEKDKKNGFVKKVKKDKTKCDEPKIGYSSNDAIVEIVLKQPDTISLSSNSSQGDQPNYSGGRLEMEVEATMPDVVTIPDLKRKMSTDLDADSDIIDDVDVTLEVKAEAPVDVTPLESEGGPSVDSLSDDGILSNADVEISAQPEDSEGSLSSTCDSDASVEVDVELASRGSIDMADTRFHDARYDGSFDLRFAGVAKRDSADSDDHDLDSKPDYERLESDDDSNALEGGWPKGLKAENSLESVEELNLDLAYGDNIKAEEPAVDIALPPDGVEGELDINPPRGELETPDTINVDQFGLATGSDDIADVIPEHVGAVIDADRDGGLIHVQEGNLNADDDIPGGEVSIGTPEENIGSDSSTHNTVSEKGDSKRNEPLKRISRKCSKLENADHVCSHVLKERTHSRSESTSSLCSTCTTRSIESSSPTFSRSYSNSGSDTEKDVKDIEDEDDDELVIGGGQMKDAVGSSGDVDVGLDLDGDASNDFKMGIGVEIDVDAGLRVNADNGGAEQEINSGVGGDAQLGINTEGGAMLSAPAGFADEINIGAEDPDLEIDLHSGRPESTGLNLKVDLGLGGSLI